MKYQTVRYREIKAKKFRKLRAILELVMAREWIMVKIKRTDKEIITQAWATTKTDAANLAIDNIESLIQQGLNVAAVKQLIEC